jgi:Lrp/AsnC family leucine-responsive transcriptional regulator
VDNIDRTLLMALVEDGRLSYQQLANQVHLSANSTADRIRRLRQSGVLMGIHAQIGLAALGYSLPSLTDIKLRESVHRRQFERDLEGVPQVLSALHTTGDFDYQLRTANASTDELQSVIDILRELGVRDVQSRIVLGETQFSAARLL